MSTNTSPRVAKQPITLIQAIARQEGFLVPGSRAQRNHNPGNINYGVFASRNGAIRGDDKNYAVFSDDETGWRALTALLQQSYRHLTLRQALLRYCPPKGDPRGDNDTEAYLYNVTVWTGIQQDEPIERFI